MTTTAAARKIATDTLRKLDATMGLGPVMVLTEDLYAMARYILSLSRPQAGTLTEDDRRIIRWQREELEKATGSRLSYGRALLEIIDRLTTPPATEEDA